MDTPKIVLYKDHGFSGGSVSLTTATPDLNALSFNDRTSSIEVTKGVWTVFKDVNYEAKSLTLRKGRYDMEYLTKNMGNDIISSARPTEIILYEHHDFSGKNIKVIDDIPDLTPLGFNDIVSSIEVTFGECTVYQHVNYQGKNLVLGTGKYDLSYIQENLGNDVISSVRLAPIA